MYLIPQSHQYQKTAAIYVAVFADVAAVFSIICNAIALYMVTHYGYNFRKFNKKLTIVAAVGDIVSSTTILLMSVPYLALKYPGIYTTGWYCDLFQSLLSFSSIVSCIAVSLIAVDRFLSVFTPRAIGPKVGWIILLVISVVFFSLDVASIFTGQFMPDPTDTYCWYDSNHSIVPFVITLLTALVFGTCFIIISVTYISVAAYCYRKSITTGSKSLRNASLKCIFVLFLYYVGFAPSFLSFIWTWSSSETHPFVLDIITPIGISFSMVVNPMLVLCLHAHYRTQLASIMSSNKR